MSDLPRLIRGTTKKYTRKSRRNVVNRRRRLGPGEDNIAGLGAEVIAWETIGALLTTIPCG